MALTATAQTKFGYVSYKHKVESLPEYAIVNAHIDEVQATDESEIARS